jgi:hypothetical protein
MVVNILVRVCACSMKVLIFQYAPGQTDFDIKSMNAFVASPMMRSEYHERDIVTKPSGPDIRDIIRQAFGDNAEYVVCRLEEPDGG